MSLSSSRLSATAALVVVCLAPPVSAQQASPSAPTDLDAFMQKVLARRDVNRKVLNDYVLDEIESFELLGPGRAPLYRTRREFTWYVRDKRHVRSPVRFGGVAVDARARDEYERAWIDREREREKRKAKSQITVTGAGMDVESSRLPTEPRFVSEAYFMDFQFEPGNYFLAGREQLDGHEVLRIEYYPTRLFSDHKESEEKKPQTKDERRDREREDVIERRMNKTALVTLWVDPVEHQIVKYTFDNVWLDFLPGAWLVRVDDIRASMTMGQPFPGVWLPKEITIRGGMTLANGSYDISLTRAFSDYREAEVNVKVKVRDDARARDVRGVEEVRQVTELRALRVVREAHRGPSEPDESAEPVEPIEPAQPPEILREIRVHGNAFVTDEEVLAIAAVAVGSPVVPEELAAVERRLKDSGRFETVEVRKRYRSLTDPTDVALILIVHERPGVRSTTTPSNPVFGRFRSRLMFLPILTYADGYGFTYGARFSTVDLLGGDERLSVPLTWGGTRRAALELERTFDTGPVSRVTSSLAVWNRENPRFEIREQRVELRAGVERQFLRVMRVGAEGARGNVEFGPLDDRQWTFGATAALDTRDDPAFPRNAVYVAGGWNGLHVNDAARINRYTADARGYLRVYRQCVLAARAQFFTSDATLPPYERLLLGGSPTLRGYRAGSYDGDRMVVTSGEVRLPLTSVISGAKLGVTVFGDAGKVADHGERLSNVTWRRGAGAGLFLIASIVRINVDVGHGFDGGGTRLHLSSGFSF